MISVERLAAKILKESEQPSSQELKMLLHQLSEVVNTPNDVTYLIGPVVRLLPCHNTNVKFTIYSILPRICKAHPDAAVLVVNTILNDCRDPNPEVKRVAVSALCSMPPLLQEYAGPILDVAMKDRHPKVRNAGVLGCSKVFKEMPDLLQELGLIDRLYEGIRDEDPVVSTNCLLVLDTVLAIEGGVVVNRSMAHFLLHRLSSLPNPQLTTVLQVLAKYTPSSEEELFYMLSELDPYLVVTTSASVVVSCIQLFLHLIKQSQPQLEPQVVDRAIPTLLEYLRAPNTGHEGLHCLLDFLLTVRNKTMWMESIGNSPDLLYPTLGEESGIAAKKLELLPYTLSEKNSLDLVAKVATTLRERCLSDKRLSITSARCLCMCAKRQASPPFLLAIISLLGKENSQNSFVSGILDGLQDVKLSLFPSEDVQNLLLKIVETISLTNKEPPPILPVLLGDYGELLGNQAVHVLETLVGDLSTYKDESICHLLLTAALKLFMKMPAKTQHVLGEVMEICIAGREEASELRWRAYKYFNLLKTNPVLLKKVLGV